MPGGQVVTAADLPVDSATIRVEGLLCAGPAAGFVLADDLGSRSLDQRPSGCRAATAGEVTVLAQTIAPDGFPVGTAAATSDDRGTILLTVPLSQGTTAVRLTAISPVNDAATTVTLSPGQIRTLTLMVPDPASAARYLTTGPAVGDDGTLTAPGGPEFDQESKTPWTGWVAVVGLLLAALALPVLRRRP